MIFFFFLPENPVFKNDLEIHFKSLHEIKLHLHLNIYFMYKINKMLGKSLLF
jgi:hypothetical protein